MAGGLVDMEIFSPRQAGKTWQHALVQWGRLAFGSDVWCLSIILGSDSFCSIYIFERVASHYDLIITNCPILQSKKPCGIGVYYSMPSHWEET